MSKSIRGNLLSGFYISIVAVALLFEAGRWLLSVPAVQAQPATGEKLVEQVDPQTRGDAVMITKVTVGDTNVQCGLLTASHDLQPVAPFQAGSDWIQNMSIFLFNRTNKTIVAGHLTLGFPETGDGRTRPQHVYPMQLGLLPAVDAFNGRTGQPIPQDPNQKPLAWGPGQTLAVHLADYIDDVKDQVENDMPLATVTKLRVHIGPFFFSDGTRWYLDKFAVPEPDRPGKFKSLPDDYFPGNPLINWPPRPG
jgi:hypothetical protein